MSARRTDQIWLFGGLTLVALLVAAGWFLLINPMYADEAKAKAATDETAAQLAKAKSNFSALKKETAKLGEYTANLKKHQRALPVASKTNGIPDFLKELQAIGTKLDVEVSGYSASDEADSKAVTTAKNLPITLNAEGDVDSLVKFLKELQNVQPRAVQVQTMTTNTTEDGATELTVTLNAYVTSTVTEKVR